jgi:hypothetical protein
MSVWPRLRERRVALAYSSLFLTVVIALASCTSSQVTAHTTTTVAHPSYTQSQETDYFRNLTKTIPSLPSYVNQHGNDALSALIAYGAGFCTFLQDGLDPVTAIGDLQSQAQQLTSRTGFPGSLPTYEEIGTDALLTLCPSEQGSLSPSQMAQLQQIKQELGGQ